MTQLIHQRWCGTAARGSRLFQQWNKKSGFSSTALLFFTISFHSPSSSFAFTSYHQFFSSSISAKKKKKKNSSFLIHYPFSLLPSFYYLILGDTPALPAGSLHISVICVRTDKPDWYSSSAVARGWRQWHQSAGRMTCLSVTTNDKAEIFWS